MYGSLPHRRKLSRLGKVDLFGDEKRLGLKPVRAFDKQIEESFTKGQCSCDRCKKSGGSQEGYVFLHTFELDGQIVARRFSKTEQSQVKSIIQKAYKAYYKEELPEISLELIEKLREMAPGRSAARIKLMLEVSRLLGEVDYSFEVTGDWEPEPGTVLEEEMEPV